MNSIPTRSVAPFAALLSLCLACGSDGSSEPGAPEPDAGKSNTQVTPPDAGKSDTPTATVDDEEEDAGEPPTVGADAGLCASGQIFCDDTCIDAIAPTGAALTARVFKGSCGFSTSCHGGASPKKGLALDTVDHLFETAVDKPAQEVPALQLVAPSSPVDSYLLDKMLGQNLGPDDDTGELSTIMPQPPSDPLCPAKIDAVRAWIQAGAPR